MMRARARSFSVLPFMRAMPYSVMIRLDITYDQNGTVTDVYGKKYLIDEVKEDEYNRLMHIGKENAEARIERYKKRTGKNKIGRNERCPCGSGKKYKHCCGKN